MITTHYIDEAKQSDLVGFLKDGHMLAEESPQKMIRLLNCITLEEVFYKLCLLKKGSLHKSVDNGNKTNYFWYGKQTNQTNQLQQPHQTNSNENDLLYNFKSVNQYSSADSKSEETFFIAKTSAPNIQNDYENNNRIIINNEMKRLKSSSQIQLHNRTLHCKDNVLSFEHLMALTYREFLIFKSSPLVLLLMVVLPMLTVLLFQATYGKTPHNVPVAVVNADIGYLDNITNINHQSSLVRFSDLYLNRFDDHMVVLNYFPDEQSAFNSVKLGKNVMAIGFRKNFSNLFMTRYINQIFPINNRGKQYEEVLNVNDSSEDDDDGEMEITPSSGDGGLKSLIKDSSIHLYMDVSRTIHVRLMNMSIMYSFQRMIKDYGSEHGLSPHLFSIPINVKQIYYGQLAPDLQPLFQAGIIICVLFTTWVAMAPQKLVKSRSNGCLERDLNQAIKPIEYLLTFQMAQLVPMAIQVLTTLLFAFYVIQIPLEGNFLDAFGLVFICTIQGLFIGTMIAIFVHTPLSAMVIKLNGKLEFYYYYILVLYL